MSMFQINGVDLPTPKHGLKALRQQLVDNSRNARGQLIAQVVNRRQVKFDGLVWPHLTAAEWSAILKEIEKFEGTLRFWDALPQEWVIRRVYWGDASEEVFKIDDEGRPTEYINCTCNIVDMGYDDL